MRPPRARSYRVRSEIDERDGLEASVLRSCQNDLEENEHLRQSYEVPGVSIKQKPPEEDTKTKVLSATGFDALADLIGSSDLLQMKPDVHVNIEHDREMRGQLLKTLHDLHTKKDLSTSFQYLANADKVVDLADGSEWNVQISRRRRRRSKESAGAEEHHLETGKVDLLSTGYKVGKAQAAALTDANGNELLPMLQTVSRVATAKEIKRARRATAARRRSGEQDALTDDEIERAGLSPPPKEAQYARARPRQKPRLTPTSDGRVIKKLLQCAAVDLALESDAEGRRSMPSPSMEEVREWMGVPMSFLAPPHADPTEGGFFVPVHDGYLEPTDGYLEPTDSITPPSSTSTGSAPIDVDQLLRSSADSTDSAGFVKVAHRRFPSSLC